MKEFIEKNAITLIIVITGMIASWTMFQARLNVVEATAVENEKRIIEYSHLVERVIMLEENRQVVKDDISEIKDDLRDLKNHFNLK